MTTAGTLQADGTRCRTGPSCRRHGTLARKTTLEAKIADLLPEPTNQTPDWWGNNEQSSYERTTAVLARLGTTETSPITWHPQAARQGYVQVPTGQPDTQLIARVESTPRPGAPDPQYYVRIWLYKQHKPVAMLKVSTYETDFQYPQNYIDAGWTPESLANTIEVHPEHARQGHGRNLITLTEQNVIKKTLHSGGSYTPEGRAAYGTFIPLSTQAKKELASKTRVAEMLGKPVPEPVPAASFDSMRFVADWDTLNTNMTYDD